MQTYRPQTYDDADQGRDNERVVKSPTKKLSMNVKIPVT